MSNMIATRPDWCISRQRVWGVPIIAFYCEDCQEPMTDRKILDRVVELFREHTADVWYDRIGRRTGWLRSRQVRALRRPRIPQRDRHSRRLVRFRLQSSCRAHARKWPALALQYVSGRRRSISRLVPQLAAGRCRAERRGALSRVRHQRLDTRRRRAAPCRNRAASASSPRK